MNKKVIEFDLSKEGLDKAIKEITAIQKWLKTKLKELRERVAYRVCWSAASGFSSALVSDVLKGPEEPNDVTVRMENRDQVTVVIAEGDKAVFIEFGAGVFYNGAVGSSPHPWVNGESPNQTIHEFTIGSYGLGNGAKNAWGFYSDDGEISVTRGTPAAMPMYRGAKEAVATIRSIAEEVFAE